MMKYIINYMAEIILPLVRLIIDLIQAEKMQISGERGLPFTHEMLNPLADENVPLFNTTPIEYYYRQAI